MPENKKDYEKNDGLSLILKLVLIFAAIIAAVVVGIKVYEKIQARRINKLCVCDDEEDYFNDEDDFCDCDECDDDITIADVTKKEINPAE